MSLLSSNHPFGLKPERGQGESDASYRHRLRKWTWLRDDANERRGKVRGVTYAGSENWRKDDVDGNPH